MGNKEITTIKLGKNTKERLGHLRVYHRETFEEILQKMLGILNICRVNPERARARLMAIDRQRKRTPGQIKKEREEMKKHNEDDYSEEEEEHGENERIEVKSGNKNIKSSLP